MSFSLIFKLSPWRTPNSSTFKDIKFNVQNSKLKGKNYKDLTNLIFRS